MPRPDDNEEEKQREIGFYHPELPGEGLTEMSGSRLEQELDPRRGQIAPMPAPELEHQVHPVEGDAGGGRQYDEHGDVEYYAPEDRDPYLQAPATGPSPYVEAQRRLEMDWLESEEARIRQQREILMRQHGGGGNGS